MPECRPLWIYFIPIGNNIILYIYLYIYIYTLSTTSRCSMVDVLIVSKCSFKAVVCGVQVMEEMVVQQPITST